MRDWRPDWRREEAYTFTDGHSLHLWAWEFLRRNPDYQRDFQEALEQYRKRISEFGEEQVGKRFSRGWSTDPNDPRFVITPRSSVPSAALRQRWSIVGFVNPEHQNPTALRFTVPVYPAVQQGLKALIREDEMDSDMARELMAMSEEPLIRMGDLGRHDVLVTFNLEVPVEPQIENVRSLLKAMQNVSGVKVRKKRRPRDNWKLYLRLLDARASGATYSVIGSRLFKLSPQANTERTVEGALRRARRMTTPAGYLPIL